MSPLHAVNRFFLVDRRQRERSEGDLIWLRVELQVAAGVGTRMRAHEKPNFTFKIDVDVETKALKDHLKQDDRKIPKRTKDDVVIATWNLTNFGLQKRQQKHIDLMAEIIKPFDVVAIQEVADEIQEVADDLTHLNKLLEALGTGGGQHWSWPWASPGTA